MLVLTVALFLSDYPTERITWFWTGYPMATAIISGVLLFFVAIFVVDEFMAMIEERGWRRISELAYLSLGHMCFEMQQGLHYLLWGEYDTHIGGSPVLGPVSHPQLQRVLESAERRPVSPEQARQLMHDDEWLMFAREGLATLKIRYRRELTGWIPAMLANRQLARIIDHMAGIDRKRDGVEGGVIRLLKSARPEYQDHAPAVKDPETWREWTIHEWIALEIEYIAFQEALRHASRGDNWVNVPGRSRLGEAMWPRIDARAAELRKTVLA